MDPSQQLINQFAEEAERQRAKPPQVLEDTIDEGKEYEKSLLQGVGGLMAGSSVEKGFKNLANSKKGIETLKKLGMSDEDVNTVVSAIKSRDTSTLTDFLTRKGTGYVNKLAKKAGIKGKEALTKLKKGELPSRQDLEDAINRGTGKDIKPSASNRSSSKALGEDADEDGLSAFDKIISKGRNAIKGTTKSLEDTLGDIPAKLSKQASRVSSDARDVASGVKDSAKSISRPNSLFDKARAEFQGEDDLAGQSSAVKKLLASSKKGRRLLRQNAKDKVEGKKPIRQKKQTSEFDDEDEEGDLLDNLIRVKNRPVDPDLFGKSNASAIQDVRDATPKELNPFTNEPIATPQQKVDALKSKADDELKSANEQLESSGGKDDTYTDLYNKVKMESERFTPQQPSGESMSKPVDFRYNAPTEEEAKAQYKANEQLAPEREPMNITDPDDEFPEFDAEDLSNVVKTEVPKVSVPPSQQTGGLDPSTLPDDAGFQRGTAKIKAKKEVDVPKSEAGLDTDVPSGTGTLVPPKPEPNLPPNDLQPSSTIDTEAIRVQTKLDVDAVNKTRNIPIGAGGKVPGDDDQPPKPPQPTDQPPTDQPPKPPQPTDQPPTKPKPTDDPDLPPLNPLDNPEAEQEAGSAVKKGLTKAFEDSLETDEVDPVGVILSGVLGIGALIAGAFGKSHHPKFVQPPTTAPYENFSVQEGVA